MKKKRSRKPSPRPRDARARPALGRERKGVVHHEPLWFRVVLDAVAKHRATKMPLDRELAAMVKRARLGKNDRASAKDVAFSYARHSAGIEDVIATELNHFGGVRPTRREIDRAALILAAVSTGRDAPGVQLPAGLLDLVETARTQGAGAFLSGLQQLPDWVQKKLSAPFLDDPTEVAALLERAPVTLACGEGVAREDVLKRLEDNDIDASLGVHSPMAIVSKQHIPSALLADFGKQLWPMDEGSQCIALSLNVQAGEHVLDLCAGGGGKSRALKSLGAQVVSADVNAKRLAETPEGLRVLADGAQHCFGPVFDYVLIDAPCSGTGTLRRSPDILSRVDPQSVEANVSLQQELLANAKNALKSDGILVYATCSVLAEENEKAVAELGSNFEPAPFDDAFCQRVGVPKGAHMLHLTPKRHNSDGFFVARFKKVDASKE